MNVDENVNANDISLQPGPTQPRTFELFASVRGGGHVERKTFVAIVNGVPAPHKRSGFRKRFRPRASVRASASACKRPACKKVGGMSACRRHDAADEFASSWCFPSCVHEITRVVRTVDTSNGKLSVDLVAKVDGKDGQVTGTLHSLCTRNLPCSTNC